VRRSGAGNLVHLVHGGRARPILEAAAQALLRLGCSGRTTSWRRIATRGSSVRAIVSRGGKHYDGRNLLAPQGCVAG